jgi:hypothetical protein
VRHVFGGGGGPGGGQTPPPPPPQSSSLHLRLYMFKEARHSLAFRLIHFDSVVEAKETQQVVHQI